VAHVAVADTVAGTVADIHMLTQDLSEDLQVFRTPSKLLERIGECLLMH